MLEKGKVLKLDVLDINNKVIYSTDRFEPGKTLFGNVDDALLILFGEDMPELNKGTPVKIISHIINGDRIMRTGRITISTHKQMNICVGKKCEKLEERRKFFKVAVKVPARILLSTRGEEITEYPDGINVVVRDINIGGVFIETEHEFEKGTELLLEMRLDGEEICSPCEILRIQHGSGGLEGYGCSFLKISTQQEQIIARYIFKMQLEHRKKLIGRIGEEQDHED